LVNYILGPLKLPCAKTVELFLFQVPREVEGSRVASDVRRGEDDAQARQRGQGRTGEVQGSNSPTFLQAAFKV